MPMIDGCPAGHGCYLLIYSPPRPLAAKSYLVIYGPPRPPHKWFKPRIYPLSPAATSMPMMKVL